ncbi:MAG: DUF4129 domain-containing protein [Mycobacteriales bacterium]
MRLLDLDREAARQAAREELSRPEYDAAQPPLLIRLAGRLLRVLGDLFDNAADAVPGGPAGLLLLFLLLGGAVAIVLARVRPSAQGGSRQAPLFAGSALLTAPEHRALAQVAAAESRWADAVRERLRAVVRDLETRGALDRRAGRTAGEVARDGGAAGPPAAEDLLRAAVLFDEVWYGGRAADAASYAVLVEVDERVGRSRIGVA